MGVRVQVPKKASAVRFALHPAGKIILAVLVLGITAGLAVFTYYYVHYARSIEAKLAAGPFANTSMLFAAPRTLAVGDVTEPQEIANELRHSGYNESHNNRMGYYTLKPDEIDIYPGPDSYFKRDEGVIRFRGGKVAQIISLADNTERTRVHAGAGADLQSVRQEPGETPAGEVRRHSAGAGARGGVGGRQAIFPALGIRSDPRHQGGVRGRARPGRTRRARPR